MSIISKYYFKYLDLLFSITSNSWTKKCSDSYPWLFLIFPPSIPKIRIEDEKLSVTSQGV